jgi:hypothetical protein
MLLLRIRFYTQNYILYILKNLGGEKEKNEMEKKGAVFAIAIAVMLLMATTMVLSSTEPNAEEVNLMPSEPLAKEVNLMPSEPLAKEVNLMPSEPRAFPSERAETELIYDDGIAEDAWAWTYGGNGYAVRFTPTSYPVDLKTARVCLWPDWPDGDHDDDGPGGEPGTLLGAPVLYTAPNWGWNDIDISGLGITITTGDFYILYKQLSDFTNCEGMCTDYGPPLYDRSWLYSSDSSWELWEDVNCMIRCVVKTTGFCGAKAALDIAGVPDPDVILDPMRALRDGYLKEEDVDRYYDYSNEWTMVMTKDPALADEAARLLVKYSPMIEQQVTGTGKVKLITPSDVAEVVSFTDGLKRSVSKNRGEIGATRSQEIINNLDEFNGQVEASEGKTFSEALQSSIYCESEPMPDLVITNIRLDGNKVKYTIKNPGEAATRGLIINTLLVDGVPVSNNLIIWSIQPGQSLEKTFILSRPLKISPNTTIVVCADFKNKVHESDEENNCLVLE